ncbi:MAG: hypothetical protein GC154_20475 [bacterium]|nr:hypothetical protein [bacterium]
MKAILILLCMLVLTGAAHAEVTSLGMCSAISWDERVFEGNAIWPVVDSSGEWIAFTVVENATPFPLISSELPSKWGINTIGYLNGRKNNQIDVISKTMDGIWIRDFYDTSWIKSDGSLLAFTAATDQIAGKPRDSQNFPSTYLWVRDPFQIVAPMPLVDGYAASNQSGEGKLDASGRYLYYTSSKNPESVICEFSNPYFTNFLYRQVWRTGEIQCLGFNGFGQPLNRGVYFQEVSAEGRYLLLECKSTNIFNNEDFASSAEYRDSNPGWQNLIVRDIESGVNDVITLGFDGEVANANNFIALKPRDHIYLDLSLSADMSDDARIVSFWSRASNLDANAASAWAHVYVFDRQTREMKAIADLPEIPWHGRDTFGLYGDKPVGPYWTRVSGDGRFVFYGEAEYNYNELKIYRYNTVTGETDVVLHDDDVIYYPDAIFSTPSVNYDGSVVAFSSQSNNLVPGMAPLNDWKVFILQLPVDPASTSKSWDRLR